MFYSSGYEKSAHRAYLRGLGLTDDEIAKPLIAVIAAFTPPEELIQSIVKSGATPFVFRTSSSAPQLALGHTSDRFTLPMRDLLAESVEAILGGGHFDGVVLCPKTDFEHVGMVMGAIEVNLPTIVFSFGTTECGAQARIFEAVGKLKEGGISSDELAELEQDALSSEELRSDFACICEVLGLALAKNGTLPHTSAERKRLAKECGARIVSLVADTVTPRRIVCKASISSAVSYAMAASVPVACVMNLIAIADTAGVSLNYQSISAIGEKTPTLTLACPTKLNQAGGVGAILGELSKRNLVDLGQQTVCGTLRDQLVANTDTQIIAEAGSPVMPYGSISVLTGNLADEGALVRRSTLPDRNLSFSGKARVFDSLEPAMNAILNHSITAGTVVIIRYEGVKGSPGMRDISPAVFALKGLGLADQVAIITDGRIGDSTGIVVGHIDIEAFDGGKLAMVADGDKIDIDLGKARLSFDLTVKEITARTKKLVPKHNEVSGLLARYAKTVQNPSSGATLKKS